MIERLLLLFTCCMLLHADVLADTFGNGVNEFTIEFVTVPGGNVADDTGYGAVPYDYQMAKHEISRVMIENHNAQSSGPVIDMYNMTSFGGNGPNIPATGISWNEAARFVNWLNTSSGHPPAYKFTTMGKEDDITPWQVGDPGYNGDNPFRNSQAKYCLPSEDEWYRAAFFDPLANSGTGGYWDYAIGSNAVPTAVSSGTSGYSVVYAQTLSNGPAIVTSAGGISPLGTMAQNGNAIEWTETSFSGVNDGGANTRVVRGGYWSDTSAFLLPTNRFEVEPLGTTLVYGFRVASVTTSAPSIFEMSNLQHTEAGVVADIVSTPGNVDIYRSTDLSDYGESPIQSDVTPGDSVIIDSSPPADRAFYIMVPTGDPAP